MDITVNYTWSCDVHVISHTTLLFVEVGHSKGSKVRDEGSWVVRRGSWIDCHCSKSELHSLKENKGYPSFTLIIVVGAHVRV